MSATLPSATAAAARPVHGPLHSSDGTTPTWQRLTCEVVSQDPDHTQVPSTPSHNRPSRTLLELWRWYSTKALKLTTITTHDYHQSDWASEHEFHGNNGLSSDAQHRMITVVIIIITETCYVGQQEWISVGSTTVGRDMLWMLTTSIYRSRRHFQTVHSGKGRTTERCSKITTNNGLTLSGQKCHSKGQTLKKALCIRCRPPRTIGSS